ncbi:MAG: BamA/TamA family outer membrane protein [Gemmatimonadota bacterium]|nr:BamA/TamA family outer membrane protein [Gemmatimonadota bacterium]
MRRAAVVVLLAVVAGLAAATRPGAAAAQVSADREVVDLRFEGNEAVPDDELRTAILTGETSCRSFLFLFPFPFCPLTNWGFAHEREFLDEDELPLDVLRLRLLYRQRGFRSAAIDTVVERRIGSARVAFLIDENEPTTISRIDVRVEGAGIDSTEVRSLLGVEPGDRLDLLRLESGEAAVVSRLRSEGHIDAVVLRDYFIPRDSLTARLTLRVDPGPPVRVGRVHVEGERDVGEEVVRSLLGIRSGERFRDTRVIDGQRRLHALEALRFANVTTERVADSTVDLRVQVAPAPRRGLRTGVGAQTDECLRVQAEFTNRNFLGDARTLRLTGRVSNLFASQFEGSFPCTDVSSDEVFQDPNFLLSLAYEQPVLWNGDNSLRARLFGERETVPDLFVRESTGGEVAFSRRLSSRMNVTLSWAPELTAFGEQSADIYFCVNFGFCDPDDIDVLTDRKWLSPATVLWAWDRTDGRPESTRGFYVAAQGERASAVTGSDYTYLRGSLEFANFHRVGGGAVLAARVRFGAVGVTGGNVFGRELDSDDVIHPNKRFFGGGPGSVRGFGLNLLGPTVLVIGEDDCAEFAGLEECVREDPGAFDERAIGGDAAVEGSLELRFPVGDRWTLAAFVDAGQVWESVDDPRSIVVTPGAGFRFRSPVGPLRLDLGYNPTGSRIRPAVIVRDDGSIVEVDTPLRFDPFTFDDPGLVKEFLRRIQLQFSIGEAF